MLLWRNFINDLAGGGTIVFLDACMLLLGRLLARGKMSNFFLYQSSRFLLVDGQALSAVFNQTTGPYPASKKAFM